MSTQSQQISTALGNFHHVIAILGLAGNQLRISSSKQSEQVSKNKWRTRLRTTRFCLGSALGLPWYFSPSCLLPVLNDTQRSLFLFCLDNFNFGLQGRQLKRCCCLFLFILNSPPTLCSFVFILLNVFSPFPPVPIPNHSPPRLNLHPGLANPEFKFYVFAIVALANKCLHSRLRPQYGRDAHKTGFSC